MTYPKPLTINDIYDIKKEHEALMKRNQETLDFWKRYGYKKQFIEYQHVSKTHTKKLLKNQEIWILLRIFGI